MAKCPLCTGALPVLSSVSAAAAARHTAARRVQRSVWVCVCHRRLHVRSPELALASSSVLPPRLFRRHGRTCAYSTTQLYTSEPLLLLLTASVFSNIIILLKWMTKKVRNLDTWQFFFKYRNKKKSKLEIVNISWLLLLHHTSHFKLFNVVSLLLFCLISIIMMVKWQKVREHYNNI